MRPAGPPRTFCIFTCMNGFRLCALVVLLAAGPGMLGQDTIRYRNTSLHGSVSNLIVIAQQYPQYGGFAPAAMLSVKSNRTDSTYTPLKKLNFSIVLGAAASRYLFFDEKYFVNFLDKNPFHVFSKRFWGGFGINYRTPLSQKLAFDADLAPCLQMIVDRSEETKTDTSGWNSVGYSNIYQGLHLNACCRLVYSSPGDFKPFVTVAVALPLLHSLARDPGDEPYHNLFKGQLLVGLGLSYSVKSRRLSEPAERKPGKS